MKRGHILNHKPHRPTAKYIKQGCYGETAPPSSHVPQPRAGAPALGWKQCRGNCPCYPVPHPSYHPLLVHGAGGTEQTGTRHHTSCSSPISKAGMSLTGPHSLTPGPSRRTKLPQSLPLPLCTCSARVSSGVTLTPPVTDVKAGSFLPVAPPPPKHS